MVILDNSTNNKGKPSYLYFFKLKKQRFSMQNVTCKIPKDLGWKQETAT